MRRPSACLSYVLPRYVHPGISKSCSRQSPEKMSWIERSSTPVFGASAEVTQKKKYRMPSMSASVTKRNVCKMSVLLSESRWRRLDLRSSAPGQGSLFPLVRDRFFQLYGVKAGTSSANNERRKNTAPTKAKERKRASQHRSSYLEEVVAHPSCVSSVMGRPIWPCGWGQRLPFRLPPQN